MSHNGIVPDTLDRILDMQVRADILSGNWKNFGERFPQAFVTARPLHIAAAQGYSHFVEMLLGRGASVNSVDGQIATPLHAAAANGRTAIIKILLDAGANPNALDSCLNSPYVYAACNGHVDSVRLLIEGGADTHVRDRYCGTILHNLARSGAKDALVSLVGTATRQDLDTEDIWGESFLYEAVRRKPIPMNYLVSLALSARAYESRVGNILTAAIGFRSTIEIKMFLRRIPTSLMPELVNRRDLYTETPLESVVRLSKVDMIPILLDAGAQLELERPAYGTVLMMACATGRLAAVKLLVARGARTSYVTDGRVFSAFAAAKNHPLVQRWLLVGRFLEGPKLIL